MIERGLKQFAIRLRVYAAVFAVPAGLLWSVCAMGAAPPMVSQVVATDSNLLDEFGAHLKGTDPNASYFGIVPIVGDLVHIYEANSGVYPPDVNGVADPLNPLIKETRIGMGAAPNDPSPGNFSCILSPRPMGGVKVFVRVFNAPTLEASSFYMDSQVFTISSMNDEPFMAGFDGGLIPFDTNDDDADGINNAWEKSYGSDPLAMDSDADGFNDDEELIAGTDLADANSVFAIMDMIPLPPDQVILAWQTQVGRTYTVECVADETLENPVTLVNDSESTVRLTNSTIALSAPNSTVISIWDDAREGYDYYTKSARGTWLGFIDEVEIEPGQELRVRYETPPVTDWLRNEWIVIDVVEGNGSVFERIVPAAEGATALYRIKVEETPDPM